MIEVFVVVLVFGAIWKIRGYLFKKWWNAYPIKH